MKVDVTQIEGYENMTAEEKVAALEGFEIEAPKDDSENLKKLLSKRNSENAELTKQLRERMSAEEKAEADRKEKWEAMEAELAEAKRDKRISSLRTEYMNLGFTSEEAQKQAEAFDSGDLATLFANHKAHVDNISRQAVADAITKNHLSTGEVPEAKEDDTALRKAMGLPL